MPSNVRNPIEWKYVRMVKPTPDLHFTLEYLSITQHVSLQFSLSTKKGQEAHLVHVRSVRERSGKSDCNLSQITLVSN